MATFLPAFDFMMQHEDSRHSYARVPDPGGYAISGINSAAWPSVYETIENIPQPQRGPAVMDFYQKNFWQPMQLGAITTQFIANRVLDEEVNTGKKEAILLLQRAVNTISTVPIEADGVIGPITLAAVNAADQDALLDAYRQQRASYYNQIVEEHPGDEVYLKNWLSRAQT